MKYYAQINQYGVCIGISSLSSDVDSPELVSIADYSDYFLWRKYENGVWSVEKFEPPAPVPQPDAQTQIAELKSQNADIIFALVSNNLM